MRIFLIVVCIGFLFMSGCGTFSSDRDTAVYLLFDVSGSTDSAAVRQRYSVDLSTITQFISQDGGTIRGDMVSSQALNTSTVPINVSFPVYDRVFSTEKKHAKQIQDASDLLRQQTEHTLSGVQASSQTALMASLEVAAKILNGGQLKTAKRKYLVIFSDMVEESPRYNFQRELLKDSRAKAIIDAERAEGRLPDLRGVKVWKSGASAIGLSDDRSRALQRFWVEYFKAAGADLSPDRYGSTLLNFP
jgi:hypothetical protein